jgi:ceramide glucosyltransferase
VSEGLLVVPAVVARIASAAGSAWLVCAVCVTWMAASLLYRSFALRQAVLFQRRVDGFRPAEPASRVRWVLLRPLHRAPAFLDAALEGLFAAARRAGARVALGVVDRADPAVKEAQRFAERYPDVSSSLRIGPGPRGWNPKIANLVQLAEGEDADVWVLSDADIAVPPDYVERLASCFAEARVGLATCPYRSVPSAGLASRIDALVSNTHFFPATCAATRVEGVRFALGSTIAVRCRALEEAGGLLAVLDEPADDWALGRNVVLAGHELAWAPLVVDHLLEEGGLRRAWLRHLRWARVSRSSRPAGYAGLVIVSHGWLPALGLAVAGGLAGAAAACWTPVLWWLAMAGLLTAARRATRVRPRDLLLLPLVDVFAFSASFAGMRGRATPPA